MRTYILLSMLAVFALPFSVSAEGNIQKANYSGTPKISAEEIQDLTYMREEEKLARDVYLYAYEKYGLPIFKNIASSEEKHMNQLGTLIDRYDLTDPVSNETPGVFQNEDLKELYTTLTGQVDESFVSALTVGAIIEDLDIKDLDEALTRTTMLDIMTTYQNLKCGSGNHLRSFVKQLQQNGSSYTPQYISMDAYNATISKSNGPCGQGQKQGQGQRKGKGMGQGQGQGRGQGRGRGF